jgi:serine-type D-Ala-D-Ala carboxypeptidase
VHGDALKDVAVGLLEEGIAARAFSGAQAAWRPSSGGRGGVCAGTTRLDGGDCVDAETRFDVASLTKLFTATAALRLAARGAIRLDDRLGAHLPELAGTPQAEATVEQALAHEAGFVPWAPLFEVVPGDLRGTDAGKAAALAALANAPPASAPDGVARYSDLGFIALGAWLERAAGRSLEALVDEEVTRPLGLPRTRFRNGPPAAATAICPWSGADLAGVVHDDNARAMGGVAGHAGLFSTASDVAALGAAWLDALCGDGAFLPRELAIAATARRASGRGLGFDLKSAQDSSAGAAISERAFGHLGFTGCSLWIDPDRRAVIALLTNRVHVGADLDAIKAFRPRFHDAMVRALDRL